MSGVFHKKYYKHNILYISLWGPLLTINGKFPFNRVEVAFVQYSSTKGQNIYVRNSFMKLKNEKAVLRYEHVTHFALDIWSRFPIGIQRGGIYPIITTPKQMSIQRQHPNLLIYAPLVFDIDVDDERYQRECPCGNSKKVCNVCWRQVIVPYTTQLIDIVRENTGIDRHCIIFSGRRGVHVYFDVEKTYDLLPEQREAIVSRIPFPIDKDVTLKPDHLVKLPLSIHPSTGNICSPIKLENLSNFDVVNDPIHCSKVNEQLLQQWIEEIKNAIL